MRNSRDNATSGSVLYVDYPVVLTNEVTWMSARVKSRTVLSVLAVTKSGVLSRAQRVDTGLPLCASHRRQGGIGDSASNKLAVVATLAGKPVYVERTHTRSGGRVCRECSAEGIAYASRVQGAKN